MINIITKSNLHKLLGPTSMSYRKPILLKPIRANRLLTHNIKIPRPHIDLKIVANLFAFKKPLIMKRHNIIARPDRHDHLPLSVPMIS